MTIYSRFPLHRQRFLLTHPVWDVTTQKKNLSLRRQFLLTHPVWDVTICQKRGVYSWQFLLTHPVWDVTGVCRCLHPMVSFLLTHPVWDVTGIAIDLDGVEMISTHTSRVGCDYDRFWCSTGSLVFLLTHPVWDVTMNNEKSISEEDFYSHIPCGM